MLTALESALVIAKALDSKKATDIKVLKTEALTSLSEYFVICTATSNTQIKALSGICEEKMEEQGEPAHHIEGYRSGTWVLMDFSHVIVHIFMDEARQFYNLERLWNDSEEIDITDILTAEAE